MVFVLFGLGAIWLTVFLFMNNNNILQSEKEREQIDLELMRSAENAGWFALETEQINVKSEYWYTGWGIIPCSYDKPQAYGAGTSMNGNTAKDYYRNGVPYYDYNDSSDYTGKIIKVTINPTTKVISVEWVDSP